MQSGCFAAVSSCSSGEVNFDRCSEEVNVYFLFSPSIKLKNVRARRKQSQCLSLAEMDTVGASPHPFHTHIKREVPPPPHPCLLGSGRCQRLEVCGWLFSNPSSSRQQVPAACSRRCSGSIPHGSRFSATPRKEDSLRVACVSPPRTLPPHRLLHTERHLPATFSHRLRGGHGSVRHCGDTGSFPQGRGAGGSHPAS